MKRELKLSVRKVRFQWARKNFPDILLLLIFFIQLVLFFFCGSLWLNMNPKVKQKISTAILHFSSLIAQTKHSKVCTQSNKITLVEPRAADLLPILKGTSNKQMLQLGSYSAHTHLPLVFLIIALICRGFTTRTKTAIEAKHRNNICICSEGSTQQKHLFPLPFACPTPKLPTWQLRAKLLPDSGIKAFS